MKPRIQVIVIASMMALFISCQSKDEPNKISPDEVLKKAQEALQVSTKFVLQEKEAFEKNSDEGLNSIHSDLEEMKATLNSAHATASEIQAQIKTLEEKEAKLEAWLEKMKAEDALKGAEAGFNIAIEELEKAKENLEKRLK